MMAGDICQRLPQGSVPAFPLKCLVAAVLASSAMPTSPKSPTADVTTATLTIHPERATGAAMLAGVIDGKGGQGVPQSRANVIVRRMGDGNVRGAVLVS